MWNLVADVGGTNMRLAAVSADGQITTRQTIPSKGKINLPQACADFVAEQGKAPDAAVVAAAGIVADDTVRLTNAEQEFSKADLARACATPDISILNDFEAAAWSLATVAASDTVCLQGPSQIPHGPRVLIGPGTGLGVAALVWAGKTPQVVRGEGGHVALAPHDADEQPYFDALTRIWPETRIGTGSAVEAEAILSGTGLPIFYCAIAETDGTPKTAQNALEVFDAARSGEDASARMAVDLFRRYLASLAGDLGMIFDAQGGVFLCGGVAQSNPWLFDSAFLDAFNSGGRHSHWRAGLPVYLIPDTDVGLRGAASFLMSR